MKEQIKLNEIEVIQLLKKEKYPMLLENGLYIVYDTFEEFLENMKF